MNLLTALGVFNYALVLIYGLFLSVAIASNQVGRREKIIIAVLCLICLLIQTPCWLIFGVATTKQLYPFIVHLPLFLTLLFLLKKPASVALISICVAYLCCQIPRFINILVTAFSNSALLGEISYTVTIVPIYILLNKFFTPAAQNAMTDSRKSLLLFGSLPILYYLFDYITVIYTNVLYTENEAFAEALPSFLILFYVLFLIAYRHQLQQHSQAELQSSILTEQLKQAEIEMASLRNTETQSAIYRHDMRHHLAAIDGFLKADNPQKAQEYIQTVQADIQAITLKRFCNNELVNLLCSSFADKAERQGIQLSIQAGLPQKLPLSDTELCAILSNSLENALNAVAQLENDADKWISLYCGVRLNKMLIEIKNPYTGQITMQNGLPIANQNNHGYGCRSIQTITQHNNGICLFDAKDGIFTLCIAMPSTKTTYTEFPQKTPKRSLKNGGGGGFSLIFIIKPVL